MSEGILGNATGGFGFPRTYIIADENGNEVTGVYVDSETIFTATDNDVREGMVYASDSGVSTGTKVIPSYHTTSGMKKVMPGKTFTVRDEYYDYDIMLAMVCSFNTSLTDSVAAVKVVIDNNVYTVGSTESIAVVQKDYDNSQINFVITNDGSEPQVLRYMFIKEML